MDDGERLSTADAELVRLASVDLNLLVPLLALLETRSVTNAAAAVGLSQPALSHALRRLRRLLGDELLVRQGSVMILTPRGRQLISPVRRALQESARSLRPRPFDPATDERTITIAMTTSTAFVVAPLLRAEFAKRAPHVVLRLHTATMRSPTVFTDDGVDVVLLSESFGAPYPRERLYDDRWVILASPSVDPALDAVELLSTQPHIMFSDPSIPRMQPYEVLDERGIPYAIRTTVTDNLLIPHLLTAAPAICLHRFQVGTSFQPLAELRIAELPFAAQPLGIDMVWNPWLSDDQFRGWLRDALFDAAAPLRARIAPAE